MIVCQLTRFSSNKTQTKGKFVVVDYTNGREEIFSCVTLELPWLDNQRNVSCIPEGIYTTSRHQSPNFGLCFHVQDVPGRSHILIHAGNYVGSINPKTGTPDTRGCILPGKAFADIDGDGVVDVTSSGPTMRRLLDLLPDVFELEIFTEL